MTSVLRPALLIVSVLALPTVTTAQSAAAVERGQKVYVEQKCGVCHSIGGAGNKRGPLDDVGSKLTAEEIRLWIVDAPAMTAKTKSGRKPPMRSYAALPAADVDALVAYMQSLKAK